MANKSRLLIYLLRRDLRIADNPILNHLSSTTDHGFTHLLPVFVFPPHQNEISGFLKEGAQSPYPPAVSSVGKFWRCGPHRAKFLGEAAWDLKSSFEGLNSGLIIRVGNAEQVVGSLIQQLKDEVKVSAVWMTEEKSYEEIQEQDAVEATCSDNHVDFRLWRDDKYFIDDRDTGLDTPQDLPDVFTAYRKSQEPLRSRPRKALPSPEKDSLPPFPGASLIPAQEDPFTIPDTLDDLLTRLTKPVSNYLADPPPAPDVESAHPFQGGETEAQSRLRYLIRSGCMTKYKDTRDGLLGPDYSTKLSAYLALGCLTARNIHEELVKFEDGTESAYQDAEGFGQGENKGTTAVRFELLWRDYMRLCTMKFGRKLFSLHGFRQERKYARKWKTADKGTADRRQDPPPEDIDDKIRRFLNGTTGLGLIDASQRELFHTGYTSNRARQNVASFFAKHLEIDWRYGAEWYEMMLVDYDVSSNWANWQYVAGVGNDPRGEARIFNPVKQAFDYDKDGSYVRGWVPELKSLEKLENLFQPSTTSNDELESLGLVNNIMVANPIKRIPFTVEQKPRGGRRPHPNRRGQGRGGRRGGGNGGTGGHGGNRNKGQGNGKWRGYGNDGNDSGQGQGSGGNSSSDGNGGRSMNGHGYSMADNTGRRRSGYLPPNPNWSPRDEGQDWYRGPFQQGRGYHHSAGGRGSHGYQHMRDGGGFGGYQAFYVPGPPFMAMHPYYHPPNLGPGADGW